VRTARGVGGQAGLRQIAFWAWSVQGAEEADRGRNSAAVIESDHGRLIVCPAFERSHREVAPGHWTYETRRVRPRAGDVDRAATKGA